MKIIIKLHKIINLVVTSFPAQDSHPAPDLQTEQSNTVKILNEEKKINLIPYNLALPEDDEDDMAQSVPVSEENKTSINTSSNLNNNTDIKDRSNVNNACEEELFDLLTTVLSKIDLRFVERFQNVSTYRILLSQFASFDDLAKIIKFIHLRVRNLSDNFQVLHFDFSPKYRAMKIHW